MFEKAEPIISDANGTYHAIIDGDHIYTKEDGKYFQYDLGSD